MVSVHSPLTCCLDVVGGMPALHQVGLDAPPGGGDWFLVEEPRGVGEAVLDALELAEDSVKVGLYV